MTEPTDAEIFVVAREAGLLPDNSHPAPETLAARKHSNAVQAFARAVLAKWGTPPAVAGEPFAWVDERAIGWLSNSRSGAATITTTLGRQKSFERPMPLHTTPQPTKAQAGAVPLTDEQIKALTQARSAAMQMAAEGRIPECGDFAAIAQNLDWLCDSFGIKGGQHGSNT